MERRLGWWSVRDLRLRHIMNGVMTPFNSPRRSGCEPNSNAGRENFPLSVRDATGSDEELVA